VIYVRGDVASLGADARFEAMSELDYTAVGELLEKAAIERDPRTFRRVASVKGLYHWNADSNQEY
jgi:methylamine---glutamate N-methyltransferase subunit B